MSNVTDLNKFRDTKQKVTSIDTEGDYISIVVGEGKEGNNVIIVKQVDTDGATTHENSIILTVGMLHSLIEELIVAATHVTEKFE
tara:strand:+ start:1461 stop:1715 length:255 start_codon:yes stop_codon:yes gene_type:complete